MPSAYAYIRVSTIDQAKNGFSLDGQENHVRRYVGYLSSRFEEQFQFDDSHLFIERGVSATKQLHLRPMGRKLWAKLRKGDHVVFPKMDRAFRNLRDFINTFGHWEKLGVTVHFLDVNFDTGTPMGMAMMQILAVFAELESRMIGMRVKEAKAAAKLQGVNANSKRILPLCCTIDHRNRIIPDRFQIMLAKICMMYRLDYKKRHRGKEVGVRWMSDRIEKFIAAYEGREELPSAELNWGDGPSRPWNKDRINRVIRQFDEVMAMVKPFPKRHDGRFAIGASFKNQKLNNH